MRDLFNSATACAVIDFPDRLDEFYRSLPKNSPTTPDMLIMKHTLYPLFQPFIPEKRANQIIEWMKRSTRGGRIHYTIGVMGSGIPALRYLRYCPRCISEDELNFGEPYWHRTHQVPGVFLCPKHKEWLIESDTCFSSPPNKHVFNLLQPKPEHKPIIPADNQACFDIYLFIAESIHWFLNNPTCSIGLKELQKRYISYLQERDLATFSGRIRQSDLLSDFVYFYGYELLERLHSVIGNTTDNWLSKMLRKPRTTVHPLRHLLFIRFLDVSPQDFVGQKKTLLMPFGRGPWPCLNPASDHYRQKVIRKVAVTRESKKGIPVGTFSCNCGFSYSRSGPDREEKDQYRIGRIKAFGALWKQALMKLSKQGLPIRELARRLNVDSKTVLIHLSQDDNNQKPKIKKSGLKSKDRELRCPVNRPIFRRIDWNLRDLEISEQVIWATTLLWSKANNLVRVTVSSIGKEIGKQSLIQKHIAKLPLTGSILDEVTETIEDFRLRRIFAAVRKVRESGRSLVSWRIIRTAGLKFCSGVETELIQRILAGEL